MRRWAGWLILAGLAALGLAALAAQAAASHRRTVQAYAADLEQLTDELVAVNAPLAEAFAAGERPSRERVEAAQAAVERLRADLEALGPPPPELAAAHQALADALAGFAAAYADLAQDLDAGRAFDQDFLARAGHAGEAVHQAAWETEAGRARAACPWPLRWWPGCQTRR